MPANEFSPYFSPKKYLFKKKIFEKWSQTGPPLTWNIVMKFAYLKWLSSGVNFSNFGTDLRYNRPTPEKLGIWATFYRFQIFALEFL